MTVAVHVLGWVGTAIIFGQGGRLVFWAIRRYRLWRAPTLPDFDTAYRWAVRNQGKMAQWPTGDLIVETVGAEDRQIRITMVVDRP